MLFFWFLTFGFSQSELSTQKVVDSVETLVNLANKESFSSNFEIALDYSIIAVKLANIANLKPQKAEAYNSLATAYQLLNDDNAEKYFLLTLKLAEELKDDFIISSALNGLGNHYSEKENTLDLAFKYYQRAYTYVEKTGNSSNICAWYINVAGMYLDFEKTAEAFPYLETAEEKLKLYHITDPVYFATLYYLKALYSKQQRIYNPAIESLDKAIAIAEKNDLYPELIDSYELKFEIYQAEGDHVSAIESLKKHQYYKDISFNTERRLKIQELNAQFKLSEYEKELSEATLHEETSNFRNKIITIIVVSFVLFFFLVMFIVNTLRERQRLKDLNDANSKTEHLTSLKSELLTNISHELRTPLYGIMGITAMLNDNKSLNEEDQNLVRSLQFSGNRLHELVNKILRITEIESDRVAEKKSITNLHTLISDIVKSFEFSAKEKDNDLVLILPASIDNLYNIDRVKLTDILDNLITNAIKFTNKGRIDISVSLVKTENDIDFLEFKVEDTGIGVAKENHSLIFNNFKQATEENTANGSGLGLSIVKNYVETLGGKMHLESALGLGSVFSFVLPCDIATPEIIAKNTTGKKEKRLDVLVVEDNKINQMITNKLIVSIGHVCTISHNGLEAVERCKTEDFDLILMDINMPLMNGFEASKTIKSFKPDVKIVALTALEISEVKERCYKVGINNVVNKPIGKAQLRDIIQMTVL